MPLQLRRPQLISAQFAPQSSYRATRPAGKTMKIKSALQTFSLPSSEGWGGLFSAPACAQFSGPVFSHPCLWDGKAAACGTSWALLEWGAPSFAMGFLSLSCHIRVHATSVKLLGHVTETLLAPSPSHTLSLSLFHPPMALHRILGPCMLPPQLWSSQVFSEGVSALGCILSHELSKIATCWSS